VKSKAMAKAWHRTRVRRVRQFWQRARPAIRAAAADLMLSGLGVVHLEVVRGIAEARHVPADEFMSRGEA
jgi:hypothetical protein